MYLSVIPLKFDHYFLKIMIMIEVFFIFTSKKYANSFLYSKKREFAILKKSTYDEMVM